MGHQATVTTKACKSYTRAHTEEYNTLNVGIDVVFTECAEQCELQNEADGWVLVDAAISFDLQATRLNEKNKAPTTPRLGTIGRCQLGKLKVPAKEPGAPSLRCGAKKRHSYSYEEKAAALEIFDKVAEEKQQGLTDNVGEETAARTGIPAGNFPHWTPVKVRATIFANAGQSQLKRLRKRKRHNTGLFPKMEKQLYSELCVHRKEGRRCGPLWLSVRGKQILSAMKTAADSTAQQPAVATESTPEDASTSVAASEAVCYVCMAVGYGPEELPANGCAVCGLGWHHICSQPACARCNPDEDLPASKVPPPISTAGSAEPVTAEQSTPSPVHKRVVVFKGGPDWRRRFAKRFGLAKRRRTNNKNKSKGERTSAILDWQSTYFQMLRGAGAPANTTIDDKWGRFLPTHRINVDKSPLGFISGLQYTYEEKGASEVWINTPSGSSLEKRQCTLQICYVADARGHAQPRLAIIFRGMGKRLSQVEKEAWDKRVDVYFQGKAWADRDFSLEWLEKTYIPWAKGSPGEKLLLMDNLDSQVHLPFRKKLKLDGNTLAWYFEPGATDLIQPTDRHLAQLLKQIIAQELENWLEDDDNLANQVGKWHFDC
ncbi:hypothetical protein CYMTET_5139 [Cymbomonas tetramitiformis]|uniref:DDE-1 domain-containing protein n=1 Tax=Cymbomonas tetramitiformis TaxID=36881 RepID=A0AAE0GZZ8_9CHLO|nr:hypothetical protein CYMTET_5139 [Cymbomonas tetramitiformis]